MNLCPHKQHCRVASHSAQEQANTEEPGGVVARIDCFTLRFNVAGFTQCVKDVPEDPTVLW